MRLVDLFKINLEKRTQKRIRMVEKHRASPEYLKEQEKLKQSIRREKFLNKLNYFSGNLREYENMKNKEYSIIDLGRDFHGFIYSDSLLFWRGDLGREQNFLVDYLIKENCKGMIDCTKIARFLVLSQWYISGNFVKEKIKQKDVDL